MQCLLLTSWSHLDLIRKMKQSHICIPGREQTSSVVLWDRLSFVLMTFLPPC